MTKLISSNGGKNLVNGLDIQHRPVVVFNFDTLEILATCENYTSADEISSDLYQKGIDARDTDLQFFDEKINVKDIVGMKLSQFQDFVENNKHTLLEL